MQPNKYPMYLLDARGLVMHMLHRGNDHDSLLSEDGKRTINTAEFGLDNFIEGYLLPILKEVPPQNIIAVWDGGHDYRSYLFPKYKANRIKTRDAVEVEQADRLQNYAKRLLAYLGILNMSVRGVEADDVLALLCHVYKGQQKAVYTVDADLLQLDDATTHVFVREQVIKGDYKGTPLNLIRLQKSIVGDSSDGYSGVNRIGEKAWEFMSQEYGWDGLEELEAIVRDRNFDELKEIIDDSGCKVLSRLYDRRDEWVLMYDLASLHPKLCYGMSGSKKIEPIFYKRVPDRDQVLKVLDAAKCQRYIDEFEAIWPQEILVTEENVESVFELMDEQLCETPYVAFDYETWDTVRHPDFIKAKAKSARKGYVDVLSSEIAGASFNFGRNLQYTAYFCVNHALTLNVGKDDIKAILNEIQDVHKVPLIAHNAAFEEQISKQCLGFEWEKPYDTYLMSRYADENREAGLKALSSEVLRFNQTSYQDTLAAAGVDSMEKLTGKQVLSYGCDDSLVTAHLFQILKLTQQMEGSWDFYEEYNTQTVNLLNRAKETGLNIDFDRMEELRKQDAETAESGLEELRSLLEQHCTEQNPAGVEGLFKVEKQVIRAKEVAKNPEWSSSKINARVEEQRLKWIAASRYVPYQEIRAAVDFKGTPAQLNKVIEGLQLAEKPEPLKSISQTEIRRWMIALEDLDVQDKRVREFANLLGQAASELKHRAGDSWEALKTFCLPILAEGGKLIKEGDELNLNSPKQMVELLYCKLALPVREFTKKQRGSFRDVNGFNGSPATDEDAIKMAIAQDCSEDDWRRRALELVIDIKGCLTRESLYYSKYPLWVHPKTGMVHPSIRDCGTDTRRPTGGDPNILQVAKGPLRSIFIPRYNDHCLVAIDFSGQELRITGAEANDPTLIEAYTGTAPVQNEYGMMKSQHRDIHSVTGCAFAEEIFKRQLGSQYPEGLFEIENGAMNYTQFKHVIDTHGDVKLIDQNILDIPPAYPFSPIANAAALVRKMSKTVNFLIIYGGSAVTLAKGLGVPVEFAERLMDMVFRLYSRLGPWQKETTAFARKHGYVQTAYGNRRHATTDIVSRDGSKRSRMERQVINSTIQSCAADILHIVETDMHRTGLMKETGATLIAPIYDEVLASVPMRNLFEYCERMQDIMNVTPPGHAIPQLAEVSVGPNWHQVVELGDRPSESELIQIVDRFQRAA